ncbi:MAG: ABC transporter permease [Gemmatimonadota bacterium]|jgi:predicted permease
MILAEPGWEGKTMGRILSELRKAGRTLLRTPLFGGTAGLILAVAVGAATAIFTVVDGVLLEPLPLPDSEELVILCERHPSLQEYCVASPPTTEDFAARTSTLEDIGLGRGWAFSISDGDRRIRLRSGIATPSFFHVLEAEPVVGRLFADDEVGEDANVVLLGYEAWTTWFGADPGVVGTTLSLGGVPHVVVGVLPEGFDLPTERGIQLWRPLHFDPRNEERRSWRGFSVVGRLRDGVGVDQARVDLTGIYGALRAETEAVTDEWRLEVMPLRAWVVRGVRANLLVFLGAVGLLLLIACANVANLLLVRSARRSREFAVRAALGARRADLAGSVLAESAWLSLVGGAGGLLLAWLGTRAFLAFAPAGIPRLDNVSLDATVFVFAVGVSALTVALFGLLPAWRSSGTDLAAGLRGASSRTTEDGRLRKGLVVAELALAVVLLTTAGLMTRSFVNFLRWDPGFEREGLAAMAVYFTPEAVEGIGLVPIFRQAETAAETVPGVQSASLASAIPLLGGRERAEYRVEGSPPAEGEDLPQARVYDVAPGYFETLGVPLTRGRFFTEEDDQDASPVLIVNEAFARLNWPREEAVGRRLTVPAGNWGSEDVEYRIVGVVADVEPLTPGVSPEAEMYRTDRQYARPFPFLVIRTVGDAGPIAERVRDGLLAGVSPDLEISLNGTMDGLVQRELVRPRFNMLLVAAFAGAALLLTAVGVYGVLAYAVVQRRREMGIRIALGSDRDRIVRDVMGDGVRMALLGILAGLAGSVAVAGIVRSVIFGVEPTDPLTLGATALLVALLAAAASLVPAVRASRVDPVGLLREE